MSRFKIIPAVYLVLIKQGKILLLRRFNTGYEDGNYSFVAGHLDGGETIKHAMIREAKEEAGLDIEEEDLAVAHVLHRKGLPDNDNERIDFFLRATSWQNQPRNLEPDKCDELNWFDLNNLPGNIVPCVRQAIDCILNNIYYSEFGWKENK